MYDMYSVCIFMVLVFLCISSISFRMYSFEATCMHAASLLDLPSYCTHANRVD